MVGIGISQFGMTPQQTMDLVPVELWYAYMDKRNTIEYREKSELNKVRLICEVMRIGTMQQINIHLPTRKKIKNPKKIMRLPWDGEANKAQSLEEMRTMMKFIAKINKNKKQRKRVIGHGR